MAGLAPEAGGAAPAGSQKAFKQQLNKVYGWYTGGFLVFIVVLAILEQMGLPRNWIGFIFLVATVLLYGGIGVMSRTSDASGYYVPGAACRPSTTAWPRAPTGCRLRPSSAWPVRST